jgi:hypothetical protein
VKKSCVRSKAVIMSTSAISPAVQTTVPSVSTTRSVSHAKTAAPAVQAASQPPSPSASAAAAISAATAALKEATESSAQTTKEAAGGDRQAQRLLAKQAAARAHIDVKA